MADEKGETTEEQDAGKEPDGIDLDRLYSRMDDDWTDRLDRFLDTRLEASEAKPVAQGQASE